MEDYKKKYKKYKQKYFSLKNQFGGGDLEDEQIDTLHFWGNQFKEHCLMLHLMLEEPASDMKNQAMTLHLKWKDFMAKTFDKFGIEPTKIVLDANDLGKIDNKKNILSEANAMMEELKVFKKEIKNTVDAGNWIGWVYPSFMKHILDELNHAQSCINGQSSIEDLVNFWNESNAEEAGLTAHLLDPTPENKTDIEKNTAFFEKVMAKKNEWTTMAHLSLNFAKELDQMVTGAMEKMKKKQVKSIIHPALIAHIDREDKRCLYILNQKLEATSFNK